MTDSNEPNSDDPADEPVSAVVAPEPDAAAGADAVIGVRIREASRIFHHSAPFGRVFVGDYVVIERGRGEQLARVVTVPDDPPTSPVPHDVRPIERLADADDRAAAAAQAERADQILADMRRAAVHGEMSLYPVAVELNLDGERGTAWFESSDHVDYRNLLEQIESTHDVKLSMQKANQRERAMLVDGYDVCGLRLCCSSWMTDFPQVGIRVAKDQDLPLNPDSISGVCGRLLCCLTFEHEVYREMRGSLPRVGKRVSTPAGMGKVIKLNVLQQKVTISLDDHPQRVDVPAEEIGLAVRTEEAPNQALVEAERAQALRAAAAPPGGSDTSRPPAERQQRDGDERDDHSERSERRPRRRRRGRGGDGPQQAAASRVADTDGRADGATADDQAPSKRSSRRRRRRKPKVVNQQADQSANASEPTSDETAATPTDGEERRPRRRRRRAKRPVNQSDPPPPASE